MHRLTSKGEQNKYEKVETKKDLWRTANKLKASKESKVKEVTWKRKWEYN